MEHPLLRLDTLKREDGAERYVPVFITALKKLISGSGLEGLKMSDYGIRREEIPTLAQNARDTMGGLFELDRHKLSFEETKQILENAYR